MPTWMNTRLAVLVNNDADNPVSPIESFTPTFNLNTEVVHSLEATHIGYIANPDSFTFTLTVRAIGGGAAQLSRLALEGTEFEIGMYEAEGSTGEWDFVDVVFRKCLITSATPSTGTVNGAPMATFSGVSREVQVTDDGGPVTRPVFTS
jgi:hypothetical protein